MIHVEAPCSYSIKRYYKKILYFVETSSVLYKMYTSLSILVLKHCVIVKVFQLLNEVILNHLGIFKKPKYRFSECGDRP